jgi:hypothetical protein
LAKEGKEEHDNRTSVPWATAGTAVNKKRALPVKRGRGRPRKKIKSVVTDSLKESNDSKAEEHMPSSSSSSSSPSSSSHLLENQRLPTMTNKRKPGRPTQPLHLQLQKFAGSFVHRSIDRFLSFDVANLRDTENKGYSRSDIMSAAMLLLRNVDLLMISPSETVSASSSSSSSPEEEVPRSLSYALLIAANVERAGVPRFP